MWERRWVVGWGTSGDIKVSVPNRQGESECEAQSCTSQIQISLWWGPEYAQGRKGLEPLGRLRRQAKKEQKCELDSFYHAQKQLSRVTRASTILSPDHFNENHLGGLFLWPLPYTCFISFELSSTPPGPSLDTRTGKAGSPFLPQLSSLSKTRREPVISLHTRGLVDWKLHWLIK